jgi:hypothetical protein
MRELCVSFLVVRFDVEVQNIERQDVKGQNVEKRKNTENIEFI